MMGSPLGYIESQIEMARRDGAPQDATYRELRERTDRPWISRDASVGSIRRTFTTADGNARWALWDNNIPPSTKSTVLDAAARIGLDVVAVREIMERAELS
jgi:hypothetical protein